MAEESWEDFDFGFSAVDADEIKVKIISTESGSDYDLVNDDYYLVIGNAHGEGSSAPDAWADELDVVYNSCQIFKTPLQVTGTLEAAVLRGESSELARLRRMKAQEHKMQKEKAHREADKTASKENY